MTSSQSVVLRKTSGYVRSERGIALGGARVTCGKQETTTLFDGGYEFTDLEKGIHVVTASLKGFETRSIAVSVKDRDEESIDFRLPEAMGTARISGIVYDAETRRPITSCGTVILIMPHTNRYAALNSGRYEFDCLAGGEHVLHTSILGYEDRNATTTLIEGAKRVEDFYCSPILSIEPPWG